jgi:hypothetical protein
MRRSSAIVMPSGDMASSAVSMSNENSSVMAPMGIVIVIADCRLLIVDFAM